ncbi:MAG: CcdB family protein [Woeseia sp.]
MPQFAVHRNPNRATKAAVPLLLDIQSDLLEELDTRVVVPLYKSASLKGGIIKILTPGVEVDGKMYIAVTPQLAGIPRKALGAQVADLSERRYDIIAALDLLVTGI